MEEEEIKIPGRKQKTEMKKTGEDRDLEMQLKDIQEKLRDLQR